MKKKFTLRQVTVNNKIWNKIFELFPLHIEQTNELCEYYSGYSNKNTIYYDGKKTLIIDECKLNYIIEINKYLKEFNYTGWKQIVVVLKPTQEEELIADITGTDCYKTILKLLNKAYTNEEIDSLLKSYKNEYDSGKAQFHRIGWDRDGHIREWKNCYYFDINGAHTNALCKMFPKAATYILELYKQRKDNKDVKKYFNYFVGMLKHKGYEGAYNHIVQETTEILFKAIREVGGYLLYANTDGFIVQNPDKLLDVSNELGDFKLAYSGNAYTYTDKNYWCIETDELKGNVLSEARKYISLKEGIVVHYNVIKDEWNNKKVIDITEENLWEKENQHIE